MRLASRILVVGAVAFGPAVVALLGCGVDTEGHLPGLPNQIPDIPGGGIGSIGAGTGSSTSTSTSTSTSAGSTSGSPVTPCDCAASLVSGGSACSNCFKSSETITGSMGCATQFMNCGSGMCSAQLQCLNGCNGNAVCINNCILQNPTYETLLLCQCNLCASACKPTTPVMCDINLDGGSNIVDSGGGGG